MSMYHVQIMRGQAQPLTDEAKEILRTEDFQFAMDAADNHKRATGINCMIESRVTVYTTQTLDEAMAGGDVGYNIGEGMQVPVTVGDHTPEPRRVVCDPTGWPGDF